MDIKRTPVVAGQFYPGDRDSLIATLNTLIPDQKEKQKVLGTVSPHAGYIYSGAVAGETLGGIDIPESVILLGPNHSGRGKPISLSTSTWKMVMGDVPIDMDIANQLLHHGSLIEADETAHDSEHSLEVQVPFLQAIQPKLRIVPLCISYISYSSCQTVADELVRAIQACNKEVLIVASSDMSHYESRPNAQKKDHMALEKLLALDPEGLYNTVIDNRISMCGIVPVTIMLLSCLRLGATQATLVRYTDSGEVSGNSDQVVGYAGALLL